MSGFVCVFHQNGAAIDRALLRSFTDFLSYRGPDARGIWADSSVGMGHALLRTTQESATEQQPASLCGRFWIVADARLDAREELIEELKCAKQSADSNAPDCELILHAYAAWGTACVDYLRGDFSFALWDNAYKQMFCARDHFGVKPFYYAQLGEIFLCSNTLNCIRLHPVITDELNDAAVGDFLLFGLNYDNATTIFRDIQRLPPAHMLTVSAGRLQVRRYWAPPTDGRIRYADPREYVESFRSIFKKAVADRLRTDHVGILLSGGLDSSSVAAVANEVSAGNGVATEIRGYTHIYESLIPHDDSEFAKEAAAALGIPVKLIALDETQLFEGCNNPDTIWPEPISNPLVAGIFASYGIISSRCRVVLSGEGGDNLMLFQMWPYAKDLWRHGEWRHLLTEVADYLWAKPFPWRGIRARALRIVGKDRDRALPGWLATDFIRRAHLAERLQEQAELQKFSSEHPIHPKGYGSLALPLWTLMFEQENPGLTGHPVEVRYPFLDLRIVDFMLGIPPFPWFFNKTLLREAMIGRLPEKVRTRPKTPLQGDPVFAQLCKSGVKRLNGIPWNPVVDNFVDRSALVRPHGKMSAEQVNANFRPYCLNVWLQTMRRVLYNPRVEAANG